MKVNILDFKSGIPVKSEIILANKGKIPLKKDGWNFNWRRLSRESNSRTFILRTLDFPNNIEGALHLKVENDMMIMDMIELSPQNIGKENKKYNNVAGCLIAFACRESFKIIGAYKGFLTFVSKSNLINWYVEKYGAEIALGQRMYIDAERGEKLINKYLYE